MITIKTFAQVREVTQEATLTLAFEDAFDTVADVKQALSQRSDRWEQVMADGVLCAVNQTLGDDTSLVSDGDEVAFFPPVTGG